MANSPRILLIAPQFFGYELDISGELTRLGFEVDFLPDRPFNSPLIKALMRFLPMFTYHNCDRFFAEKIEKFGRTEYTTILIIQGEGITRNTLSELRTTFPRANLVFYTWDSIANKPSFKNNLAIYDRFLTFDPVDANIYGMYFRPLFYVQRFNAPASFDYSYDLSFIGTIHSDRYKIICRLLEELPSTSRTFTHFYLQANWMFDFRRIFTKTIVGAKRDEFRFSPLGRDIVQTIFHKSRAVIDIEHPRQRGATMRSIEAMGSDRKIITTNNFLRNYDFFNPDNIHIIDRNVPKIPKNFLQTPYQSVPEKIKGKYSLQQWVSDVCDFSYSIE